MKRKLREASLLLDNGDPVLGKSPGNTRGLNIRTPVYIGGLNTKKFTYAEAVGVSRGFTGCILEVSFIISIYFVVLRSHSRWSLNYFEDSELEPKLSVK